MKTAQILTHVYLVLRPPTQCSVYPILTSQFDKNSLSGNGFTANPALCVIIRQNTSINKLNTSTNSSEKDGLIFLSKIPGKSQLHSTTR